MSLANDMLKGAKSIAQFTGFDEREIHRFLRTGALPLFKVGKHVCGRRSEIEEALSAKSGRGK